MISWVDRTFLLWAIGGLLLPFASAGSSAAPSSPAVTGLLWGGLVRVFVLHHFTYSINSLCHVFGNRDFETGDESRNLALIAIPTFGEAWHNNHHAFPTSATHGLGRWQVDISALVIDGLEKVGAGLGRRPRPARAPGRQGRPDRAQGARRALVVPVDPARRRPGCSGTIRCGSARTATSSPIVGLAVVAGEALQGGRLGGA